MNSIVQGWDKLEDKKKNILSKLQTKSEDELKKSLPGEWSMIQAMRHVYLSEFFTLQYMTKKSKAGDDMKKRPFMPRLSLRALYAVFYVRLKFKAPEVIANPPLTSLAELESDWKESRIRLKKFLDEYPEGWKDKAVYKHPFLGMLNIEDAVNFLNAHLQHHIRQVNRIERQIMTSDAGDNT